MTTNESYEIKSAR